MEKAKKFKVPENAELSLAESCLSSYFGLFFVFRSMHLLRHSCGCGCGQNNSGSSIGRNRVRNRWKINVCRKIFPLIQRPITLSKKTNESKRKMRDARKISENVKVDGSDGDTAGPF